MPEAESTWNGWCVPIAMFHSSTCIWSKSGLACYMPLSVKFRCWPCRPSMPIVISIINFHIFWFIWSPFMDLVAFLVYSLMPEVWLNFQMKSWSHHGLITWHSRLPGSCQADAATTQQQLSLQAAAVFNRINYDYKGLNILIRKFQFETRAWITQAYSAIEIFQCLLVLFTWITVILLACSWCKAIIVHSSQSCILAPWWMHGLSDNWLALVGIRINTCVRLVSFHKHLKEVI